MFKNERILFNFCTVVLSFCIFKFWPPFFSNCSPYVLKSGNYEINAWIAVKILFFLVQWFPKCLHFSILTRPGFSFYLELLHDNKNLSIFIKFSFRLMCKIRWKFFSFLTVVPKIFIIKNLNTLWHFHFASFLKILSLHFDKIEPLNLFVFD